MKKKLDVRDRQVKRLNNRVGILNANNASLQTCDVRRNHSATHVVMSKQANRKAKFPDRKVKVSDVVYLEKMQRCTDK